MSQNVRSSWPGRPEVGPQRAADEADGDKGFLLRLEDLRGCFTHPVSHCLLSARPCGETEA